MEEADFDVWCRHVHPIAYYEHPKISGPVSHQRHRPGIGLSALGQVHPRYPKIDAAVCRRRTVRNARVAGGRGGNGDGLAGRTGRVRRPSGRHRIPRRNHIAARIESAEGGRSGDGLIIARTGDVYGRGARSTQAVDGNGQITAGLAIRDGGIPLTAAHPALHRTREGEAAAANLDSSARYGSWWVLEVLRSAPGAGHSFPLQPAPV